MASDISIVLKELNQKPIAYYPIYKEIMNSTSGGVILSQLLYWASKYDKIWKTDSDLINETRCTVNELRSAKVKIKELPFIKVTREGIPATTCYELSLDLLHDYILQLKKRSNKISENHESAKKTSSIKKTNKKPISENHESSLVESTNLYTENTEIENTIRLQSFSKEKEATGVADNQLNGLVCKICGEVQYETPSGATCINGHGGEEGIVPHDKRVHFPNLKRIGLPSLKKIPTSGLTIFNYSIQAKQILKHWHDYGGKLHINGDAKGAPLIQSWIDSLLFEGWNPYIKITDDEIRTKQWTVSEICKCIEHYSGTLKKDISNLYFDQFVLFKQRGRFGRSKPDYSILVETFENLPKDSKTMKFLEKHFNRLYPDVHIYPVALSNIANFLDSKIDDYIINDPGNNSSLPLMFVRYVGKVIEMEGKTDSITYMSGTANLDKFFSTLVKSFRVKKRTKKEKADWLIQKPIMEANRQKALARRGSK